MNSARIPSKRPFSVADALVLIGAAAVGLALIRGWDSPLWCPLWMYSSRGRTVSPARLILHTIQVGVSWTIPFGLSLTVALLALRFRRPRPSIRRITRQPGTIACFATLAACVYHVSGAIFYDAMAYLTRPQSAVHLPSPPFVRFDNPRRISRSIGLWLHDNLLELFPFSISPSVAVPIAVGWCVLIACGRWRRPTDWIDRSGRWLGAFWIALAIAFVILTYLYRFII